MPRITEYHRDELRLQEIRKRDKQWFWLFVSWILFAAVSIFLVAISYAVYKDVRNGNSSLSYEQET